MMNSEEVIMEIVTEVDTELVTLVRVPPRFS